MFLLFLVYILLVVNRTETIYVSDQNGTNTPKLRTARIKTLSWQPQNVVLHHNYSKVYTNEHNRPIHNYSYVRRTYTQSENGVAPIGVTNFSSTFTRTPKHNIYTIQNATLHDLSPNFTETNEGIERIRISDDLPGDNTHRKPAIFINGHLSGEFSQINTATSSYSPDFSQTTPQRRTLKVHLTPQVSKYTSETIEIYRKCPKDSTGQFVYELSCNQFLNCWKGKGYVQNCPAGTLFNPQTSECDFKEKVRCVTGPREATLKEREPLTAAIQAKCPEGFSGIIPHYTDCSKFINCHNGAEFVMDCAPGTLFDIKSNNCDYPHRALCVGTDNLSHKGPGEFGQSSQANKVVTVQGYNRNVTYQLGPPGSIRQNQRIVINNQLGDFQNGQNERESRFYETTNIGLGVNKDPQVFSGGNRGFYVAKNDQLAQNKQWYNLNPVYIGGKSEINPEETPDQNTRKASSKCPDGASGLFPHPTVCEKFLNCDRGRTFVQDCGPGTVFNPKFKVCDFPYNVDCNRQDGTYTTTNQPDELSRNYRMVAGLNEAYSMGLSQDYCVDHKGFSIYPENCSRFVYCDDSGELFIGICHDNMFYDPSRGDCEYNIDCKSLANQFAERQTWQVDKQYDRFRLVNIGNEIYSLGLTQTFCVNNLGFSTHPLDCTKFVLCTDDGKLLLGICNANTFFDPSEKTCDSSYRCGVSVENQQGGFYQVGVQYDRFRLENIGNELTILGLDNTGNRFCLLNPGFSLHRLNCSKFLLCTDDGTLLLGICNTNMFYDPTNRICDYNSNCDQLRVPPKHEQSSFGNTHRQEYHINRKYERFRTADISGELNVLNLASNYCQSNKGFSPHQFDCTKFLLCNENGGLLLGICNPNTFYDPTKRNCTSVANCGHIQRQNHFGDGQNFRLIESSNEMNLLGLDMNFCSQHNGFLVHPRNCSRFLLCQNQKLMLGICNPRSYFNPTNKTCDSNYRCDQARQTGNYQWENQQFGIYPANEEITFLNLNRNYCNIHDGFSEYPGQCSKFLFCKYRRLYIGICNGDLVYNQSLKTCDSITGCRDNLDVGKHGKIETGTVDCQTKSPGLHAHPTDCSKFINCDNGVEKIHYCAAGTVFNPVTKECDFPNNVDCTGDGIRGNLEQNARNRSQSGNLHAQNRWQDQFNQHQGNLGQNGHDQGNQWSDQFDQNNQWSGQFDQNNQWSGQFDQNNQRSDQFGQNNQWNDQFHQNNVNQTDQDNTWQEQWSQNQNENNFLSTTPRVFQSSSTAGTTILTYDQNKKPSTRWPPAFPSTDPNADYVFEANDLVEAVVPSDIFKETCSESDFHCTKDTCIDPIKICDGSLDCPDGDDEKNCETYVEQFSQTPSTKIAVRERIKYRNITLALCAKYCVESQNFTCKAFNFRKMDGACFLLNTNVGLSGSLFILPTYDYYEYKKFSIDCSKKYECANKKCIDEHQICDGIDDCLDRYDEKGCTAEEIGYSVRLIGSEKSYEGALEVKALGKIGLICDDMFNMEAANIVCKELGFELGAAEIKGNSFFLPHLTPNETFFMMDDLACTGNESSIRDCDFSGWGISNCMEKEAVGVVCRVPNELCAHDMWKCQTVTECVPLTFVCDGVNDCSDESDEASQFCDAPNELRLVGGRSESQGRIEIRHHGTWGTICDDDFNEDAGKVVCKSLGYKGPARVKKEAYFGQGQGPIWLDQVFCQGNESSLEDCIRWDWGVHNCEHDEDVGVVCDDYANEGSPRNLDPEKSAVQPILPEGRCGFRNDDIFLDNDAVHFRVVKGAVAHRGHYPWQASIKVKGRNKPSHWCGAVVISSKFVLTAAHCLSGFTKGAYVIVAGDYDVNEDEGTEQQVYIEEFYIHEHFRQLTKMNNDIALVRLKGQGFNITRDVQPICLPNADFSDEVGLNCTISGFGSVQSGRAVASNELRAGWIPIQPSEICKMPHIYGKSITDGMFCAGPLDGGIDACDGDSGGPLACLHDGYFTLIGMTSWGQHCGEANKPGVYVKIAHYRQWIDDMMLKHG